jgi:hypothetical protein
VVRVKGLEPPRHRRQNLNLVRLPIPPHPHNAYIAWATVKSMGGNTLLVCLLHEISKKAVTALFEETRYLKLETEIPTYAQ